MRFLVVVLFVVSDQAFCWGERSTTAQYSCPPAQELERESLHYRREFFRRGHVVLHSVNTSKVSQQSEFEYDITFDEDRIRFDRKSRLLGSPKWGIPQKYVVTRNRYIEDLRGDLVINVGRPTIGDAQSYATAVFHPRALGMTVSGTAGMVHGDIEAYLGRADRDTPKVTRERLGDLDTWRIDYRLNRGAGVSVWIASSEGLGVVRAEERIESSRGLVVQTVVSELTQYPEGNVWYPRRSTHELSVDGEWQDRQVITVKEASFGDAVDQIVFTLLGMDITPGRVVSDSSQGAPTGLIWNGKKTVGMSVDNVESSGIGLESTRSFLGSPLLIANAILCAVLACFLIVRMVRRCSS